MTTRNDLIPLVFDLDGGLLDSQSEMRTTLFEETGFRLEFSAWTRWDTIYRKALRLLPKKSEAEVQDLLFGDAVMSQAKPAAGSQEAVAEAVSAGFLPIIATGRPLSQLWLTLDALESYFPDILPENVFLLQPNDNSIQHKVAVIRKFRAMAFIEDSGETAIEAASQLTDLNVIIGLVDKPWNGHTEVEGSIFRFGDWRRNDYQWEALIKRLVTARRKLLDSS